MNSLIIALKGTTMTETKSGKRIVVIGRTVPAHEKINHREPSNQRARSQRIVIIRDGKLVRGSLPAWV